MLPTASGISALEIAATRSKRDRNLIDDLDDVGLEVRILLDQFSLQSLGSLRQDAVKLVRRLQRRDGFGR